jgi:hypothetical protein
MAATTSNPAALMATTDRLIDCNGLPALAPDGVDAAGWAEDRLPVERLDGCSRIEPERRTPGKASAGSFCEAWITVCCRTFPSQDCWRDGTATSALAAPSADKMAVDDMRESGCRIAVASAVLRA